MNDPNHGVNILDVVALTTDLPDHDLRRGQVGTAFELLQPGIVEVAFPDDDGRVYALLALPATDLLVLHHEPAY